MNQNQGEHSDMESNMNVKRLLKERLKSNQLLAFSALFISVCALVVSIIEMRTMKVQQEAMVYPHLDIGESYNAEGFSFKAKNTGTGLAIVKSVEVYNEKRSFQSWEEIIDYYLPEGHGINYSVMGTTSINGRVIPAGEEMRLLWLEWSDEARVLIDSLGQVEYRVCYCSILEDCWAVNSENRFPQSTRPCSFNEVVRF